MKKNSLKYLSVALALGATLTLASCDKFSNLTSSSSSTSQTTTTAAPAKAATTPAKSDSLTPAAIAKSLANAQNLDPKVVLKNLDLGFTPFLSQVAGLKLDSQEVKGLNSFVESYNKNENSSTANNSLYHNFANDLRDEAAVFTLDKPTYGYPALPVSTNDQAKDEKLYQEYKQTLVNHFLNEVDGRLKIYHNPEFQKKFFNAEQKDMPALLTEADQLVANYKNEVKSLTKGELACDKLQSLNEKSKCFRDYLALIANYPTTLNAVNENDPSVVTPDFLNQSANPIVNFENAYLTSPEAAVKPVSQVTSTVNAAKTAVSNLASEAKDTATSAVNSIKESASKVVSSVTNTASSVADKAKEEAGSAVEAAKEKASSVAEEAKTKASSAVEAAKEKASSVAEEAKAKASSAVEAAKEKASSVAEEAKAKASSAVEAAKEKASSAVEAAKEKASTVAEEAKAKASSAVEAAKEKASTVAEEAKAKASSAVEAAKSKASSAVEVAKEKASTVAEEAKSKASSTVEAAKEKASSVVEAAKAKASSAVEATKEKASSVVNSVKETVSNKTSSVVSTVTNTASAVVDSAKDKASAVVNTVKDKTSSVVDAVKDKAGNLVDKAKDLVSTSSSKAAAVATTTAAVAHHMYSLNGYTYSLEKAQSLLANIKSQSDVDAIKTLNKVYPDVISQIAGFTHNSRENLTIVKFGKNYQENQAKNSSLFSLYNVFASDVNDEVFVFTSANPSTYPSLPTTTEGLAKYRNELVDTFTKALQTRLKVYHDAGYQKRYFQYKDQAELDTLLNNADNLVGSYIALVQMSTIDTPKACTVGSIEEQAKCFRNYLEILGEYPTVLLNDYYAEHQPKNAVVSPDLLNKTAEPVETFIKSFNK